MLQQVIACRSHSRSRLFRIIGAVLVGLPVACTPPPRLAEPEAGKNLAELVLEQRHEELTVGDTTMAFRNVLTYLDAHTGQPYSGPVYRTYDDGSVRGKGVLAEGHFEGVSYSYFESGKLWMRTSYVNGIMHGPHEEYFENGQLETAINNVLGKTEGPVVYYHPNGAVLRRGTMVRGRYQGLYEEFAANGRLLVREIDMGPEGNFGPRIVYDESGAVVHRGVYALDPDTGYPKPCGPWIFYGEPLTHGPCPEGLEVPPDWR